MVRVQEEFSRCVLLAVSGHRVQQCERLGAETALGLARALRAEGWGVAMWPLARWGEELPADTTVVVSMIESFVPGYVPAGTALVAWVRNWTAKWAALPYLDEFDAVYREAVPPGTPSPVNAGTPAPTDAAWRGTVTLPVVLRFSPGTGRSMSTGSTYLATAAVRS